MSGIVFALLGAAVAVGLAGAGSACGVGICLLYTSAAIVPALQRLILFFLKFSVCYLS